jgi:hypothetical protein
MRVMAEYLDASGVAPSRRATVQRGVTRRAIGDGKAQWFARRKISAAVRQ